MQGGSLRHYRIAAQFAFAAVLAAIMMGALWFEKPTPDQISYSDVTPPKRIEFPTSPIGRAAANLQSSRISNDEVRQAHDLGIAVSSGVVIGLLAGAALNLPFGFTGKFWSIFFYTGAAFAEIGGCFAFWAWLRLSKSPLWLIPGIVSLVLFAVFLTRIETEFAGRAYAAYGGVYIAASLLWLWIIEGARPDRWDAIGASVCLAGATLILLGPRTT